MDEKPLKTITVRLSYDDYKALKQHCLDNDLQMTAYIKKLIAKDIKKQKK